MRQLFVFIVLIMSVCNTNAQFIQTSPATLPATLPILSKLTLRIYAIKQMTRLYACFWGDDIAQETLDRQVDGTLRSVQQTMSSWDPVIKIFGDKESATVNHCVYIQDKYHNDLFYGYNPKVELRADGSLDAFLDLEMASEIRLELGAEACWAELKLPDGQGYQSLRSDSQGGFYFPTDLVGKAQVRVYGDKGIMIAVYTPWGSRLGTSYTAANCSVRIRGLSLIFSYVDYLGTEWNQTENTAYEYTPDSFLSTDGETVDLKVFFTVPKGQEEVRGVSVLGLPDQKDWHWIPSDGSGTIVITVPIGTTVYIWPNNGKG